MKLTVLQVSTPNRTIVADASWTVHYLKMQLFTGELASGKKVRFLFGGGFLRDECTLEGSGLRDGYCVHAVISDAPPPPPPLPPLPADGDVDVELGGGGDPRFGDLEGMGVVRVIAARPAASVEPEGLDWSEEERAAAMGMPAPPPPLGTMGDFVFGLGLGMLFGILAILWVWQRQAPYRRRMGILVGMFLHLIFKMATSPAWNPVDDQRAGSTRVENPTSMFSLGGDGAASTSGPQLHNTAGLRLIGPAPSATVH